MARELVHIQDRVPGNAKEAKAVLRIATARGMPADELHDNDLAAMRAGLLAAGDVRSAMRAVARLSPDNKRPPGLARLEDFEAIFASTPIIVQLLYFAASEAFGAALTSAWTRTQGRLL